MRRRIVPAVLVTGLLLVMGACGDPNQGDVLARQFEKDWAGTADVAEIDTNAENVLPYAGTATGTLVLEDGTSTRRVRDLAEELRDYLVDHDDVDGEIRSGDLTFSVLRDEDATDAVLGLWEALDSDDRVARATSAQASTSTPTTWRSR